MRHGSAKVLAGLGAGWLLGARAGRRRYDATRRALRAYSERPQVQTAAGVAAARVSARARQAASGIATRLGWRRPGGR